MAVFAHQVHEWQVFYAAIMGASATLAGLLFVAVSLNKPIISHRDNSHLKFYSQQTFGLFLSVIGISLTFLIPGQTTEGVGIPIICIGTTGLLSAAQGLLASFRVGVYSKGLRRYGYACAAFIGIMFASVHVLWFLDTPSLYLVMGGVIMLMVSATRSSWFLLIELQEKK